MNGSEGPKRSTARQRILLSGLLVGVTGVLGFTGAGTTSASGQRATTVVALEASRAVPRTFPPTASSTPSTVGVPSTTAVPPSTTAVPPSTTAVSAAVQPVDSAAAPTRSGASAAPAPAPPGGSVEEAIATYFGDVYDQAVGVARCESSLDPNAVSAGGSNWGLFQINTVHQQRVADMGYSWDQILDPYVNAAVARSIYDDAGGWGPWGCRRAAY